MVTSLQMNFQKLLVLSTILITSTGLATASQAELTFFPEESSTRIDSFTSYELTVENIGPVEDSYTFTSSSVEEIDIAPRKINLEPDEEEVVNVWYNPSQDRQEGTYSFSVTATSRATNQRYSKSFLASVIREHDVSMELDRTSETLCRGEKATYEIEATNDGIQKEEFQLSTDYGSLSQERVTLEDGETKTVTLTASSDNSVTKNFNLRAASTTSYAQVIKNVQFNAETCYDSEVSVTPREQRNAGGSDAEFDVTVRNLGTRPDTFSLTSSKGEFTENTVELLAGGSETVQLEVETQDIGKQTVEIQANGRSKTSTSANIQTYNGNNMEISFESQEQRICETEDAEVETVLRNTGETDETYDLKTSKGSLEDQQVQVDAGESETVDIDIAAENLETGQNGVEVTATASTYGKPVKSKMAQVVVENCWDVSLNVVPQVASAGENRSVIYEINVENTGTQPNTYELEYQGPDWASVKPETLEVAPGQSKKSYMYAGIPFRKEGNVQITATAVGTKAEDSQTVELVIGKNIEEAIRDSENELENGITGQFLSSFNRLEISTNLARLATASIIALLITGVILVREW